MARLRQSSPLWLPLQGDDLLDVVLEARRCSGENLLGAKFDLEVVSSEPGVGLAVHFEGYVLQGECHFPERQGGCRLLDVVRRVRAETDVLGEIHVRQGHHLSFQHGRVRQLHVPRVRLSVGDHVEHGCPEKCTRRGSAALLP